MNSAVVANVNLVSLGGNLFRIGWERGAFSDVIISAFGQDYRAHRIILSQSPYFETMLQGEWSDSNSQTLKLSFDDPHIGPNAFRRALEFLYGSIIDINPTNVHGTLAIGCFLGLEPLCEQCISFVSENLTLDSFHGIYILCSRFDYGLYSRRMKELCKDFLRMHAFREARDILNDLSLTDVQELLIDDVLWVPTEVERFFMLQNSLLMDQEVENESPMSCQTMLDQDFHSTNEMDVSVYSEILTTIRFEHFPESTLNLLKAEEERNLEIINEAIGNGIQTQTEMKRRLSSSSISSTSIFGSKLTRHFRVFSKSDLTIEPRNLLNRSFRVGIEFRNLADVFKTKGLGSGEYFYAGALWRVHMVQRRSPVDGNNYIGVFVHRRCAHGMQWSDNRESVEATLRVRLGWGENKVDRVCHGKFDPDSWYSYGWPQFIKDTNFKKCTQIDGSLRLTLNITLQL